MKAGLSFSLLCFAPWGLELSCPASWALVFFLVCYQALLTVLVALLSSLTDSGPLAPLATRWKVSQANSTVLASDGVKGEFQVLRENHHKQAYRRNRRP